MMCSMVRFTVPCVLVVIIFILFIFNSGAEGSLDTSFSEVCALELSERC